MYLKIIANLIAIVILGIVQIAFVSGLPVWFREINLMIIALILLLGFSGSRIAYWWGFGLGVMLDIYLFVPFGVNIASLLITVVFSNFLLANFLTNRSLYSFLVLISFAIISYEVFSFLIINTYDYIFFRSFASAIDGHALLYKFYGLGINLVLVGITLYALNHFGANFKPVFLRKRKLI
ncbi:MAG: hypothetical protein US83_C0005G0032 [Candidatus Falkowbacteria bacterium GW2011_GWC2_38_22]|uniref:Rod shape-determining protein MreD n=1 Tax=Candidatus Falkowbacteria bacterium GW2011_GWE1_38_31 TaxID=1618638 RepID=A0A0G0JUJ9_9BACT|nr:MAG: hypothetical protein US73_C0003G0062 [Candidatus Falkowbacteria bacterium GW2011_GWF2_38_1205]KKQ61519.1 MAG: hypothetical protein US83_C0005G0032 [Candidatus Falkowbacteria bacterium GW2011_GWC2_38_22]KKQ63588.1 MAG: hypothetical protein US84_C0005G0062 [Candidatus Falkowbacteria bacterium GW2011_GWF1_38_22]KKQ65740.1 MAG: hypothetical protein US87_C0005G0062 [Candidatus Falkowbacteria bacterium GW2011_GWE2_38_254]KKQ70357.1 MAG: hypothetical protein US91_C0005G0062 [Candidatus Falkowb